MKPKFIDEYAKMYNDYIDGMYNYIDEFYFALTVLSHITDQHESYYRPI